MCVLTFFAAFFYVLNAWCLLFISFLLPWSCSLPSSSHPLFRTLCSCSIFVGSVFVACFLLLLTLRLPLMLCVCVVYTLRFCVPSVLVFFFPGPRICLGLVAVASSFIRLRSFFLHTTLAALIIPSEKVECTYTLCSICWFFIFETYQILSCPPCLLLTWTLFLGTRRPG